MGLPPLRPGFRQKVLCQRAGVRLVRGRGAPSKQASHLSPRLEVQDTLCGDVDTRSSFRVVSNPGPPPADVRREILLYELDRQITLDHSPQAPYAQAHQRGLQCEGSDIGVFSLSIAQEAPLI